MELTTIVVNAIATCRKGTVADSVLTVTELADYTTWSTRCFKTEAAVAVASDQGRGASRESQGGEDQLHICEPTTVKALVECLGMLKGSGWMLMS